MKMRVTKMGIDIIPENEIDEAYIENTLGLKNEGDYVRLVRQNAVQLSCIANLTTCPFPVKPQKEVACQKA
jgi:hypothetical protein